MHMFRREADFQAFERVMVEAHLRQPIRILSYCVLAVARGTAGELDGSRQRSFDHEGLHRVRVSIEQGRPYGEEKWVRETVKDLGLEQTVRPEGRPRKAGQSATEATSKLRGFYPAVRLIDKPMAPLLPSPAVRLIDKLIVSLLPSLSSGRIDRQTNCVTVAIRPHCCLPQRSD
jgi:hypothetical protein